MSDKLFNAELRDAARTNEIVSMREQHRLAMEAAEKRTYTEEEIAMYERTIELDAEDLARAQADWEAAEDQGHDWNDYDDPIDFYGEDGYFGFNG
tara:strand:- start:175 stop:459 length:285 start_codon:yes stop_codon:yes gene_type:complete